METIGQRLKTRRVERGLSLAEVHEVTKITMQSLAALEEDRFDAFPNKVYSRAFLRDYANYLGIDSTALLDQYESEWNPDAAAGNNHKPKQAPKPAVEQPKPAVSASAPRKSKKWAYVLGFFVIVGAAVGGGIYGIRTGKISIKPMVRHTQPSKPATPTELPVTKPVVGNTSTPVTAPTANTEALKPAAAPATPAKPAIPADQVKIDLQAVDRKVWILVKREGKKEIDEILQPGEKYSTVGKDISVKVGDASALEVTINGKSAGRFGKPKQFGTSRTFTPKSAEQP